MNAKILIAGVAIAALAAGGASANVHKKMHHMRSHERSGAGAYAEPAQPIPYAQLDAYMKASPKERRAMASGGMAATGSSADTSATGSSPAPSAPAAESASPAPPAPASTDMSAPPAAPQTPATPATPPTPSPDASTTPPK